MARTPDPTVVVVAYDDMQALDLTGPVEVLDMAGRHGATPPYRVRIATPGGTPVRTSSGVVVGADVDLAGVAAETGPLGTVLVVGGRGTAVAARDAELLAHLRALSARADRTASVCSGAIVLAAAGLLEGRRATTHWSVCDRLAQVGDVDVEPDRIYVVDGDTWTSAGVTAGIDMALALVEADHGPDVAHAVAAQLVVFVRRPGGQAQFSAALRARPARSQPIAELQRWLPDNLTEDLSVPSLAARVAMSPRSFARAYRAETGTTPAAHVEELRVEAARRLLETTDMTVAAVAREVGLAHAETLHRAFLRRTGTTPSRYRQHFARTA